MNLFSVVMIEKNELAGRVSYVFFPLYFFQAHIRQTSHACIHMGNEMTTRIFGLPLKAHATFHYPLHTTNEEASDR